MEIGFCLVSERCASFRTKNSIWLLLKWGGGSACCELGKTYPPDHHSTMVLRGLRRAFNWSPIMPRGASVSGQPMKDFLVRIVSLITLTDKSQFLINQSKSDCFYHFPIDFEPNGIPLGFKSI